MFLYLSILLLVIITYYFSIKKQIKYNKALIHTFILLLLFLSLSKIDNLIIRNIVAVPVFIIICLDYLATQFYGKQFNSRLDYSFALSIIDTNKHEAKGMVSLYKKYITLYIIYLTISLSLVNLVPNSLTYNSFFFSTILIVFICTLFVKAYLHNKRKNNIDSFFIRFISELPISNIVPFMQVYRDKKIIQSLSKTQPKYHFNSINKDVDVYVLILGESARPLNMSLYGYHRQTTPNLDKNK